jgi:ribosomal protein S18 acetylase RimI-like enzyme
VRIVSVGEEHVEGLVAFFGRLPDRDLTFIKEDAGPDAIRAWPGGHVQQCVAVDGDGIAGYVAVKPLVGWSDHVGELRLVVDPQWRRAGVGRALTKHAVLEAVRAGRRKVVVELGAEQEGSLNMFLSLGFEGEALLRDHIRDREGELSDLVMLAHFVDGNWAALEAVGIAEELGAPR